MKRPMKNKKKSRSHKCSDCTYSPGPWRVSKNGSHPWVVEADSNIPGIPATIVKVGYRPNAQLIAAAPELFAHVWMEEYRARCDRPDNESEAEFFRTSYGFEWNDWQAFEGRRRSLLRKVEAK